LYQRSPELTDKLKSPSTQFPVWEERKSAISESNNVYIYRMDVLIYKSITILEGGGETKKKQKTKTKKKNAPIIDYLHSSSPRPVSDLDARRSSLRSVCFCFTGQVSNAKEEWGVDRRRVDRWIIAHNRLVAFTFMPEP